MEEPPANFVLRACPWDLADLEDPRVVLRVVRRTGKEER